MSPADLTAREQVRLLEDRRLSARELLVACRERAESTEPVVNALVTLDWEHAESLADALDADSGLAADAPGAEHATAPGRDPPGS